MMMIRFIIVQLALNESCAIIRYGNTQLLKDAGVCDLPLALINLR